MTPADLHEADRFSAAVGAMQKLEPVTLRGLWIAAADASDALAAVCGPGGQNVTDFQFNRLERAACQAEQALRDFLLTEHGLTTADLRRSVL